MIWRWVISFSLCLFLAHAATVSGTIVVKNRDKVKAKAGDTGDTVVWLDRTDSSSIPAPRPQHAQILQKNKTFQPHLLAIPAGSAVDFPNTDPIFHNAFSNYDGQVFDIGLYPPSSTRSVTFSREGVVRVFCNIHSTMSAVIVVLQSPYFARTNADGQFRLERVPEGSYRLKFYHERATEQTLKALEREVEVGGSAVDIGTIELTESGYLPVPHLNKYGKPYSTTSDAATYPGARH